MPKKQQEKQVKTVPIDWVVPETTTTAYVTNMVVQDNQDIVTISFFEVRKPFVLGDAERVASTMAALEEVPAVCVARIAISADRLSEFIEVLRQVERRRARAGHAESEEAV